jgi:hypothetical protein
MGDTAIMVLESARKKLSKLAPLAKQVNDATDAFMRQLRLIEEELEGMNLGVAVTLRRPLETGELIQEPADIEGRQPLPYRCNKYLAYGRFGDEWRILVITYREYQESDFDAVFESQIPLAESPRDVRIAAADQIDDLIDLLAAEATGRLRELNMAIDKMQLPGDPTRHKFGVDEHGVAHIIESSKLDGGLCGARILTTNFFESKACHECEAILRQREKSRTR